MSWVEVRPEFCCRDHPPPGVLAHPGFGFCRDCLAYMRGDTGDDPLADRKRRLAEIEANANPPGAVPYDLVDLIEGGGT